MGKRPKKPSRSAKGPPTLNVRNVLPETQVLLEINTARERCSYPTYLGWMTTLLLQLGADAAAAGPDSPEWARLRRAGFTKIPQLD
jgi:hypothetical protein